MIPGQFDYVRPSDLEEALRILADREGEAKVLSGGYSLIPLLKLRLAQPGLLVDIGRIGGLDGIVETDDQLGLGAVVLDDAGKRLDAAERLLDERVAITALPRLGHQRLQPLVEGGRLFDDRLLRRLKEGSGKQDSEQTHDDIMRDFRRRRSSKSETWRIPVEP